MNETSQAMAGERAWNLAPLTPAEPGRRNRRTLDALLLAWGAFLVGLGAVVVESASAQDERVADALVTVLGWAPAVWRVTILALLGLLLAILADVLVRRRWALLRDLTLALLVVVAAASVLGRVVDADWLPVEADLWSRWGFPEVRLAAAVAIVAVAGPELIRPVRKLAAWLVPMAAVGLVALDAASPTRALAGLALGLGAGALVRFAFGTAAGVPPTEQVRRALASLGVDVEDLRIADRQRIGAAEFVAHDDGGAAIEGAGARTGCAGHAAARSSLAALRLPRPADGPSRSGGSSKSSTRRWRH